MASNSTCEWPTVSDRLPAELHRSSEEEPMGGRRPFPDAATVGAMTPWLDSEAIEFMLDDCETWAVVGLSGDPRRTAYSIAALLQQRGKRIVPIHPDAA